MSYTLQRDLNRQPLFQNGGPVLQNLDIELTERCNNACRHCYINLPANDKLAVSRELTTAQWQDILRQAAELGALSVRFTGGEPLLRPDFAELYLTARRLGMKVLLFTNARRITPELAELFARIPPLEKIEITVYGMHPESYAAVTGAPGGYAEFRRGVDLLLERQVPFYLKGALLTENLADREAFEAWTSTIPGMEEPPVYTVFFYQRARRDSPARMRQIEQVRLDPALGVALLSQRPGYRAEMSAFCQRFTYPTGAKLFVCGAGSGGSVDAYGLYQPCLVLRDPQFTIDLKITSLKDALQLTRARLPAVEASHPEYLRRCARCFLRGLCDSCPAASFSEHGLLDQPVEYFCQVTHAKARQLGLLADNENAWEVQDWKERIENLKKDVP